MEKFYLIEVANGDSKVSGKAVYEYTTKNEALASFHSKLGSAMKSDLFESELLIVIDSYGTWYASENYVNDNYVPKITD